LVGIVKKTRAQAEEDVAPVPILHAQLLAAWGVEKLESEFCFGQMPMAFGASMFPSVRFFNEAKARQVPHAHATGDALEKQHFCLAKCRRTLGHNTCATFVLLSCKHLLQHQS